MKKFTLKLLSLMLVCIMALPLLLACTDGETPSTGSSNKPSETTDKAFLALSEADKAFYILEFDAEDGGKEQVVFNMEMVFKYSGIEFFVDAEGKTVEINTGSTYLDYSETTTSMTAMENETVSVTKEGFYEGKAFYYSESEGEGEGFYMVMTKDEYLADKDEESSSLGDFDLTKADCGTVSCKKNSQGGWVATYTDISADGLEIFNEIVMAFGGMIESELKDVVLTLTVDSSLKPVSASIDFIFADTETQMTFDMSFTLGDSVQAPEIDLSGYTDFTE